MLSARPLASVLAVIFFAAQVSSLKLNNWYSDWYSPYPYQPSPYDYNPYQRAPTPYQPSYYQYYPQWYYPSQSYYQPTLAASSNVESQ